MVFPREGILGLCFRERGAGDGVPERGELGMVFPREGILGLCCLERGARDSVP